MQCRNCGRSGTPEEYTHSNKLPWGLEGWCDYCWKVKRQWAWTIYRKAGLPKPLQCSRCLGSFDPANKQSRISGHHLNYNFPLFVVWLCQKCHNKAHREEEKLVQLARANGQAAPVYQPSV